MQGADNQQERLDGYIAGYVDGEGSFSVTVNRNSTSKLKFQLVPEFHVSQNGDRREVLDLIKRRLDCGYIKRNGRKDRAVVLLSDDDRTFSQRSSHSLSELRLSHRSKETSRPLPGLSKRWLSASTTKSSASYESWKWGCP